MDFSDITRSGTAPSSKSKPYMAGVGNLAARPKTRAVDNDIQDTNSELRMNRIKGGLQGRDNGPNEVQEAVFSLLSDNAEPDFSSKRVSSRGRNSKDPRKSGHNNLLSGLSAYTQNIPNIVLNASKKPSKPTSANSHISPRPQPKDPKNLHQLNELRAAYGADILLGKGEKLTSPARPKSTKYPDVERKSAKQSKPKEVVSSSNRALSPSSSPSPSAEVGMIPIQIDSIAGKKSLENNSASSSVGSDLDHRPKQMQSDKRAKPMVNSRPLLRASFGAKSAVPLPGEASNESENFVAQMRDAVASTFSPSPPALAINRDVIPLSHSESIPPSSSSYTERVDGSGIDIEEPADFYIDEECGDDDGMDSPMGERRRGGTGVASSNAYSGHHTAPVTATTSTAATIETTFLESDEAVEGRPQSRKLYLGSSKAAEKAASTSKAPRSAGARYGPFSPIAGGENNTNADHHGPQSAHVKLKKNGSYSDVQKSFNWIGDEHSLERRPPSRQSSAFPVHLAEPPAGKRDNTHAQVAPSTTLNRVPSSAKNPLPAPKRQSPDKSYDSVGAEEALVEVVLPVQPNVEAKTVKKTRATSEEEISSPAVRPPSRQKVAAQHLFDHHHHNASSSSDGQEPVVPAGIDRWNKTEGDARRREGSSSGATSLSATGDAYSQKPATTSSGAGRLRTANRSSRGALSYDPHRDGFTELDPRESPAPFTITVSYGPEDYSLRKPAEALENTGHHFEELNEQFVDLSLRKGGSPVLLPMGSPPKRIEPSIALPAPVRPKSVSSIEHSAVGAGTHAMAGRPGRVTRVPVVPAHENDTLRSKSAHSYAPTAQTGGHYGASKPRAVALDQGGSRQAPIVTIGAWSDGSPQRAQNTVGLGADSGWTSPSMLQGTASYNMSSSPAAYSDNLDLVYGRDEDDDITVLTDEESGANFEHDLSLQSFQLESSLGEDFLSLFAPAGR